MSHRGVGGQRKRVRRDLDNLQQFLNSNHIIRNVRPKLRDKHLKYIFAIGTSAMMNAYLDQIDCDRSKRGGLARRRCLILHRTGRDLR